MQDHHLPIPIPVIQNSIQFLFFKSKKHLLPEEVSPLPEHSFSDGEQYMEMKGFSSKLEKA